MTRIIALTVASGLASGAFGDTIASQNFNVLDDTGAQTFDSLPQGSQLTNSGSANNGGPGLDFATFWGADTRGEGLGPVTPANDTSDFIGVNTFTGANSPDVGPGGAPVATGIEQNFEFNDGDGRLDLVFEPVNTSDFTDRTLSFNFWIMGTTYESDDFMSAMLSDGVNDVPLFVWGEADLKANSSADDGTDNWGLISFDLEDLIGNGRINADGIVLTISIDNNSSSENIFVDNVAFEGIPAPSSLALLGLGGLVTSRRRR